MNDFFSSAIGALREYVDGKHDGNVSAAARALGISVPTFHTWLKGERKPSMGKITPVLEELGARIQLPSAEPGKDVCFVDAKKVEAGKTVPDPEAESYLAVPVVGEVGAGPGYMPEEEVKSWFLVYKYQEAVRYKKNLIAVEIGKNSTSMVPTLSPGDIVLVDRDDRDVKNAGHIMLVTEPSGEGKIKRVSVQPKNGDFSITYYSDNVVDNPPDTYSLRDDFFGDFERAIVGRVIWAWSDVRGK